MEKLEKSLISQLLLLQLRVLFMLYLLKVFGNLHVFIQTFFLTLVFELFIEGAMKICKSPNDEEVNQKMYVLLATLSVLANVSADMALKWIDYQTKVVAKCKLVCECYHVDSIFYILTATTPIFVMLLCVLFGRRTYSVWKWFVVGLVVLGVSFFTYEDSLGSASAEHHAFGICLIAFSLVMDGLQGAFQDRIRHISKPLSMNNMFYVNTWSSCILMPILAVSGEGRSYIEFVQKHPTVALYTALAAFIGTAGQACIAIMVAKFGSLQLSLISTSRRMFTVFLSALVFGDDLTEIQWAAASLIFVTLLINLIFSDDKKVEAEISETSVAKQGNPEHYSTKL